MLFSEIYGSYFNVLAAVLEEAAAKTLTKKKITAIINEKAFAESIISIPDALERGEWKLLNQDMQTPLCSAPTMPLTLLQKRWMKSLLLDPRIKLFAPDETGFEDIKPLYDQKWFVYFDRYENGDPYDKEQYIHCFQTILQALQEKMWLEVSFCGRSGVEHKIQCFPKHLEYSSKDDRFRLIAADQTPWGYQTINLARITSCRMMEECKDVIPTMPNMKTDILEFELIDERNALDRVMLHFSHLEKETRKVDENKYYVKLRYDHSDQTEILIRILSFGAMIRVLAPEYFITLIRERILRQECLKKIDYDTNMG